MKQFSQTERLAVIVSTPMTYDEFKRQVGKSGLTMKSFADLLNMRVGSLTNYSKAGAVPDNIAVIAVMAGDMADAGLDFRASIARVGIERKKPRGSGFKQKVQEPGEPLP